MAKYIVFPTKAWPLVVASLRRQHQWQTRELERAISGAIDALNPVGYNVEEARELLVDAHRLITPHPSNPGRWTNDVSVAEAYAKPVRVVESDELTPVQQAVLQEVGATTGYAVDERRRIADTPDEGLAHQRAAAEEAHLLDGMKAAPNVAA